MTVTGVPVHGSAAASGKATLMLRPERLFL
jgi:hypothetical protein